MDEGIASVGEFEGDGRAEGVGFLTEGCSGPESFVILGAPRDRPGIMVGSKTIFGHFIRDGKIGLLLLREDIAKRKAIVEAAEDDVHVSSGGVGEMDDEFVMLVSDESFFAPYGLPCIVIRTLFVTNDRERVGEVRFGADESECGPVDDGLAVAGDGVLRCGCFGESERKGEGVVRGLN